jgi:hypothetical protein
MKVFSGIADKIRYLTMTDSSKVWMPDTFFRNEKIGRFHNILQPNLYVRVFPNGDVLYSIRVSLTCACSMQLALFPLDKQTCNLDVASCKYIKVVHNCVVERGCNFTVPSGTFEVARYYCKPVKPSLDEKNGQNIWTFWPLSCTNSHFLSN